MNVEILCDRAQTLASFNVWRCRPAVGIREGPRYGSLGLLQQQQTTARSVIKSSRGSKSVGRGAGGVNRTFKGVRTRKGVKGFLVEIRPPKWKKTIWLGTYTTLREAAGAYDAGTSPTHSYCNSFLLLHLSDKISMLRQKSVNPDRTKLGLGQH